MMQVTGSSIGSATAYELILSTQLAPSGLYFSVSSLLSQSVVEQGFIPFLPEQQDNPLDQRVKALYEKHSFLSYNYRRVDIVVDTVEATPVPIEWLEGSDYTDWLRFAGFLPTVDDIVVRTADLDDMSMLLSMPKAIDQIFREEHGDRVNYLHPILIMRRLVGAQSLISLMVDSGRAYIVAAEEGAVKCMLPLTYRGDADIVFVVRKLQQELSTQPQLNFIASDAELVSMLKSQFQGSVDQNADMLELPMYNLNNLPL